MYISGIILTEKDRANTDIDVIYLTMLNICLLRWLVRTRDLMAIIAGETCAV